MTFEDIVDQAIDMVRRRGQVSYRLLKRQFDLDDEALADLTEELLFAHPVVDEDGRGVVWTGQTAPKPGSAELTPPAQEADQPHQPPQGTSPPEPPTSDAERRLLTVMFCDLVGSTALSGQMDAEAYREVVQAYQEAAAEVIRRYEGHIAQYLGDGLLIYFGYPSAHEDDAVRAVHTGLGILDAVHTVNPQLQRNYGVQLAVRIGVHTGPVVVGDVGGGGRHERLALGETPNIASRLEGRAAPSQLVISAGTQRLVGGAFDLEDLGVQTLRGVSESMRVYAVRGESIAESRFEAATVTGLTPLVGRDEEISLVLRRWEQAKDGDGQVVLLSGEAGIGKSRITQALRERVSHEPHIHLRCQCSPYYTNSALYPIVAHLERAMRCEREALPATKLDALEALLAQSGLPIADAAPLFAVLLSIPSDDRYPSLHLSPQRQKAKTIDAMVEQVRGLSQSQPVLYIFEDVHWIDPTSLEMVESLIARLQDARVLLVLTCRPEFLPQWGGYTHVTSYTLNRLSRQLVEAMVHRVTNGKALPAEVLDQIVAKTDGVPLFVEELTKTVLESGLLADAGERYELARPLAALAIPDTLHGSLMARLDRLAPVKATAQIGAAIGREFSYELLAAVSPLPEVDLQEALRQLVQTELVFRRGQPPEATYLFKHALVQDAAYSSLLQSTRQQLHSTIAMVLEGRFPAVADAEPEVVAHHYTEAGLPAQAVVYWQRAGQRAAAHSANAEAIMHLRKGLEVLSTLPPTPDRDQRELALHMELRNPITSTKGWMAPELEQSYTRAYALCQEVGETQQRIPVLMGLAVYYHTRADYHVAREFEEEALELAQQDHDETSLLVAHVMLGMTLCNLPELAAAREHLDHCLQLYNPQQHQELAFQEGQDPKVSALCWKARALWLLGYPDQAQHCSDASLAWANAVPHVHSRACALGFTAILHQIRRDYGQAQELAEALMVLSEEQGFTFWVEFGAILQGWQHAMAKDYEEGIGRIQQSMAAYDAIGFGAWQSHFLSLIAEAYTHAGHVEAGLEVLIEASAVVNRTEERWWEAELYRLQGEFLLQANRTLTEGEAESCFLHAITISRHQAAKSLELRAATSLARLWQSQDKRQDAYDLLAPVYEWFNEGFDTTDLQEAKGLLDQLRAQQGSLKQPLRQPFQPTTHSGSQTSEID
jgi:TOMM system kinase/cyclase fusion protein